MKKVKIKIQTREESLYPYLKIPLEDRLKESGAIDLRDNHTVEKLENGMIRIHPIDHTKKY